MNIAWEIPDTWGTRKLDFLAPEESDKIKPSDYPDEQFNYWGLDAIEAHQFTEPRPNWISGSEVASTCIVFDSTHVLYSRLRPYLNKVIVPTEKGIGSTEWVPLRSKEHLINRRYLAFVLRTNRFLQYANSGNNTTGARLPRMRKDSLREADIPIPSPNNPKRSLLEQQRIVNVIEALLGEVREMREIQNDVSGNIDRLFQATLYEIFAEANEDEWEQFSFEELVNNYDRMRVPVKKADRAEMQGKYPYYGASGIIDYVDDYLFEGEHLLVSEDGANLEARKYPIAFLADGKFWVNNHAHVVQAKPELTSNQYLAYAIRATDISNLITGSAQPKLNQGNLNSLMLWVPKSRTYQENIVQRLRLVEEEVNEISTVSSNHQETIQNLEQSILAQAFRGEL